MSLQPDPAADHPRVSRPAWTGLALVVAIALAAIAAPAFGGVSTNSRTAAEHAAKWIASKITADGGYGGDTGGFVGGTIDAALALAAADAERPSFERAVAFVEEHYEEWVPQKNTGVDRPGALGLVATLAAAAGRNPRNFGDSDLVARIKMGAIPSGADEIMYAPADFASSVWLHSWAVMGLRAAGEPVPAGAVTWLKRQQCPAGGWMGYRTPQMQADGACGAMYMDPSALAIQVLKALNQAPLHDPAPYLLAAQHDSGGYADTTPKDPNANSTALAIQAIVALGEHPASGRWLQADGDSPVSALLAMQLPCNDPDEGALLFMGNANRSATAQGTWGLALRTLPFTGPPSSYTPGSCGVIRPVTNSPTPTESASVSPSPTPSTTSAPSATPTPSGTPAGRSVERLSGDDRYDSSVAVSREAFAPGVEVAFLASGGGFADALSAGLAGAKMGGPVLLTMRDALPQPVHDELIRLRPRRIMILGGPAAVGEAVVQQAARIAPVERVSGPDRYETAGALSRRAFPDPVRRLLIATGEDFPDALAAIGAAADGPVLLVERDRIPTATESELRRLGPFEVFVLGGDTAVSDEVVARLRQMTGATVQRLAGENRYQTAVAASRAGVDRATVIYVAAGDRFADALAGAAAAGVRGTGILLVGRDGVPDVVLNEIRRLDPERILILGGLSSVSEDIARRLRQI